MSSFGSTTAPGAAGEVLYPILELEPSSTVLASIKDGWFTENCEMLRRNSGVSGIVTSTGVDWKNLYTGPKMSIGQKFSLQVEEVLVAGKSKYQVRLQ